MTERLTFIAFAIFFVLFFTAAAYISLLVTIALLKLVVGGTS